MQTPISLKKIIYISIVSIASIFTAIVVLQKGKRIIVKIHDLQKSNKRLLQITNNFKQNENFGFNFLKNENKIKRDNFSSEKSNF